MVGHLDWLMKLVRVNWVKR